MAILKNINRKLLPIKAHFFLFMAAMGPILPQLSVYGKELGISPVVMGTVTSILPILFLLAKPVFGLIVDVLRQYRKAIFLGLVVATSTFYALLYFVPSRFITKYHFKNTLCSQFPKCDVAEYMEELQCNSTNHITCTWQCGNESSTSPLFGLVKTGLNQDACFVDVIPNCDEFCDITCIDDIDKNTKCLYQSFTFWSFIILMSLGTVGFNVLNSISDAICFDVIDSEYDYGKQRVWGTLGFGITALISGYVVECFSGDQITYAPALIVMLVCTAMDFFACLKLQIPIIQAPVNVFGSLKTLINNCKTITFIIYATLAGVIDSFAVYFLFWYLEDLALATDTTNIKLLEGFTVAAETLGAEVIFFYVSGKIIQKWGYAVTFSLCFVCYGIRYGLISIIPSPWWIIPIEFIMQGPTYALIYSTIVAYANAISPPGMSATMQGIAAGMNDGFGFAVGSMIGGVLYKYLGGAHTLRFFCGLSILCGASHFIISKTVFKHSEDPVAVKEASHFPPQKTNGSKTNCQCD